MVRKLSLVSILLSWLSCYVSDNNEDADHVFMMFSATFPKEARQLAREHLKSNYIRIRIARAGSTVKRIHQEVGPPDLNRCTGLNYVLLDHLRGRCNEAPGTL